MATRQPYRLELGSHFNEGARLLWVALERAGWTQAKLRALLGVKSGTISRWLYGDKIPNLQSAIALEDHLKIPTRSWTQTPKKAFTPPAARAA